MSQPEYYDGIDSYLYSLVHYATNPQNSNPPQNNPNNFNNQQFTNTAFYPLRQTANNQERTVNPWPVEPGRYYENQTQASYNSNNWIQNFVENRRARYPQASDRNFRGNYNYYNFNAFNPNQNHYNYRFGNGPPVGQSGPPPFRSYSNNIYPNRVWDPPNQPQNNKPPYKPSQNNKPPYKPPQNTKPKNNFNKGKQKVKKRSPKKQNKSFKRAKNQKPATPKVNNVQENSGTSEKTDLPPTVVENTPETVQNNEVSTTISVPEEPADKIDPSVENRTKIPDQEMVNREEVPEKDVIVETQNQNTSEKPPEDQNHIVESVDKTNEPPESVNQQVSTEDNKENLNSGDLFVIDTEADYSYLERVDLTPAKQTTSEEVDSNIQKNQKCDQIPSTPGENVIATTSPSSKELTPKIKRRREKLRARKSKERVENPVKSEPKIPIPIPESQIIVIESDSDLDDSVIEIPKTPAPVVVISDSDDEDLRQEPEQNPSNQRTPEKSGQGDTLIILNDEIFATPESMKRSAATTPKQRKKKQQRKNKANREIPSRMSTPDSRCSYDDFMQNDICLQNKNTGGETSLVCLNSQSLDDITNIFDKGAQNVSNELVSETESSCCSDWIDKNQGAPVPLTFENAVNNSNTEKRVYKELDLNQFANMITTNRASASTDADDLISIKASPKKISENTTAVSFGADDSHKIIKTKKRSYVDTESSSDESELGNPKRKVSKNKKDKNIKKKQDSDDKNGEEASTVIWPQQRTSTLSSTNLDIEYDDFSRELGTTATTDCTENTIDDTTVTNTNTNQDTVICVSEESVSEVDISSSDAENCTIILNTNKKPVVSEQECLNDVKSPTKNKENITKKSPTESSQQQRATDLKMRFNTYWTPDRNEFYNKSWGGENYDHDIERTLMPNSLKDWMIPDDNYKFSIRGLGNKKRCNNCRQRGHERKDCPVPTKACGMCGSRSHHVMRCTQTRCLTCYSAQKRAFVQNCEKCKKWLRQRCRICNSLGHVGTVCPDLWRRYHLTTQRGEIVQPKNKNSDQQTQWCSVCARSGHLSEKCRYYFNVSRCPPDPMTIQNYADIYDHGTGSPKKRKLNSNNDLWDIHKLTYDKLNNSFVELNSDGQRKVVFQTERTPTKSIELCESQTENAQMDQTKNTNENIGNGREEFEIAISPSNVKLLRTKRGRSYLAKLKKKYSIKLIFERKSQKWFTLKVDCPIEHSKTVNDKIRNYISGRESIQLEKIRKDFAMLPEIFKLANPNSLFNRWEKIKQQSKHSRRTLEQRMQIKQIKRELCAFFIGKEKLHDQQRASHSLDILEKFFSSTANQNNLNYSVINAHEFIFLNKLKLPKLMKKWEELHKMDKTDSVQEPQETQSSSVSIQKVAKRRKTQKTPPKPKNNKNENFAKYTDELLAVCKNNRLKSRLQFTKKKINLNQFNNKIKRKLLGIGRLFKIPYRVENTS